MKVRRLGRTGIDVSGIVFGTGPANGLFLKMDDDTRLKAVRKALDAGVNWFDTAPMFLDGRSEEMLGRMLGELTDKPFVSTKVAIDTSRPNDISGQVERSIHDSLVRLKRPVIPLLQLHNSIEDVSGKRGMTLEQVLGPGGAIEAMEKARDQGLIQFIGITALGDRHLLRRVVESGRIDTAKVAYNIVNPSAGRDMHRDWAGEDFSRMLDVCQRNDVGVFAIRVLPRAFLAAPVRPGKNGTSDPGHGSIEEQHACAVLDALGDRVGDRIQTALRFVMSHPAISSAIYAVSGMAHLETGLAGLAKGTLQPEVLKDLDSVYAGNFKPA